MARVTTTSSIPQRLEALRELMRAKGIDACIAATGDPHMSEYISEHYMTRQFITGFTGSAGTAVITLEDAGLWTDSRYFLQAEDELGGSGITLYRLGQTGTIGIIDYLRQQLPQGGRVSVDGRMVSSHWAESLRKDQAIHLITDLDLIGEIWEDRPPLEFQPIEEYPLEYAGISRKDKIRIIRQDMEQSEGDLLLLSGLSDIAWLLNLRGSDIQCNPVFFSFLLLSQKKVMLYAAPEALPSDLADALAADGIGLVPYDRFYDDLAKAGQVAGIEKADRKIMLDRETCSDRIRQALPDDIQVLFCDSPVMERKCVKNAVEMDGTRAAHIRDGVAMCKFLFWLKSNVAGGQITEISAAEKLHWFRSQQDLFRGDSFETIVGYGPHAAIVHYSAAEETDVTLEPSGLVLIDSGGQYLDGTTDITRTIALGPLTEQEKILFTAVLRGHINLARARFPRGLNGTNLDYLAHEPLWRMGLDYGHGTGHGVGQFLNVHEDPNRIHWSTRSGGPAVPAFAEGMLTSDEPGYYEEGAFGIRHESLLLCVKDGETEHGQFLRFEEITMAPFDREAILSDQMQPEEIDYLNDYHRRVFETIAPHLEEEERKWLEEACRPIG